MLIINEQVNDVDNQFNGINLKRSVDTQDLEALSNKIRIEIMDSDDDDEYNEYNEYNSPKKVKLSTKSKDLNVN